MEENKMRRPAFLGNRTSQVAPAPTKEELAELQLETEIMEKIFISEAARSKDGLTKILKKFSIENQEIVDDISQDFKMLQQKIHQEKITTKLGNFGSYIIDQFTSKTKAPQVRPIDIATNVPIVKAEMIINDIKEDGIRAAKTTKVYPDKTPSKKNLSTSAYVNKIHKKIAAR